MCAAARGRHRHRFGPARVLPFIGSVVYVADGKFMAAGVNSLLVMDEQCGFRQGIHEQVEIASVPIRTGQDRPENPWLGRVVLVYRAADGGDVVLQGFGGSHGFECGCGVQIRLHVVPAAPALVAGG